ITAQPLTRTAIAGETVVLRVEAEGSEPLQWQWWRLRGEEETIVEGADGPELTIADVGYEASGDGYRVVISNGVNSVTSQTAVLTVVPPVSITVHPEPRIAFEGNTVEFAAEAEGYGEL